MKNCQTPILVLPDDVPPHPFKVAMEVAMLAPNSQVSLYPWKDTPDKVPLAVRHIRMFLESNRPAAARRRATRGGGLEGVGRITSCGLTPERQNPASS